VIDSSNVLYRVAQICIPEECRVELPHLGELLFQISLRNTDRACAIAQAVCFSCETLSLQCGIGCGLLMVERGLALDWMCSLLGCETLHVPRPLSRIECGLFEGVLATLSERLGFSPALRFQIQECTDIVPSWELVAEIQIEFLGQAYQAWAFLSDEIFREIWRSRKPLSGRPPADIHLELARTRVPVKSLTNAKERDWVVFEEMSPFPLTEPWPVHIRQGRRSLPSFLHSNGSIEIKKETIVETDGDVTKQDRPFTSGSTDFSGQFEEIVAEVGAYRLTEKALEMLLTEGRFDTERPKSICLRRLGAPWAEGIPTEIEGEFAVRIKRKLKD
jgi:hypothetical protein